MAKLGLHFIQYVYPTNNEEYLYIMRYRYRYHVQSHIVTIIDLEVYESNICILSFFRKNFGNEDNKYKLRSNLSGGHAVAIFKACLEAFNNLEKHHALIFSASNDIDKEESYNSRYSAYLRFLEQYFEDYTNCRQAGSMELNTFIIYHNEYKFADQAKELYRKFEEKTLEKNFA